MNHRSINSTAAATLSRSFERACKTREPSELIRLLSKDAVWRDNDVVHVGRDEIWSALGNRWANTLHCTLQPNTEFCDAHNMVIRFESEWQNSVCGRWYRTSGKIRAWLDDNGYITKVESQLADIPISVADRRLLIAVAPTAEPIP